jgi:mono/diheme cytochrome c family protein
VAWKTWIRIAALACFSFGLQANAADPERGRALYELRCGECHNASVHARTQRAARDYAEVRAWVMRWNQELRGAWREEEIDDVTAYLNQRYYSYPCTGVSC